MALSLRRANAVKDALVREGVPAQAITVIGSGEIVFWIVDGKVVGVNYKVPQCTLYNRYEPLRKWSIRTGTQT